jgi:hypothetical protein
MASWSALLALTGFHYSGITKEITFGNITGNYFWSNGYAYGTVEISKKKGSKYLKLTVLNGQINLRKVTVEGFGSSSPEGMKTIKSGQTALYEIKI